MSKYITHFQTEAAYQAALPTLELPNVSLVDELGEVHYHRALYGAHAGDICLYDVAEGQKIFVTASNWNLTDYPTASYPIVGVAVADETPTGVILVSHLNMASDGSSTLNYVKMKWQNTNFDWGLTKYTTMETALTDNDGKSNTETIINAIKAYDIANNTDNITGNIPDAIQKFYTAGTNSKDWYIPSAGELYTLGLNYPIIETTIEQIKTSDNSLASELGLDVINPTLRSSTEYNVNNCWYLYRPKSNTVSLVNDWQKNSTHRVRPFLKLT